MDDTNILNHISELVDEEHRLRARVQSEPSAAEDERARLRQLEAALDQCWDLLRRRRAARQAGRNPEETDARSPADVRQYLQ